MEQFVTLCNQNPQVLYVCLTWPFCESLEERTGERNMGSRGASLIRASDVNQDLLGPGLYPGPNLTAFCLCLENLIEAGIKKVTIF